MEREAFSYGHLVGIDISKFKCLLGSYPEWINLTIETIGSCWVGFARISYLTACFWIVKLEMFKFSRYLVCPLARHIIFPN